MADDERRISRTDTNAQREETLHLVYITECKFNDSTNWNFLTRRILISKLNRVALRVNAISVFFSWVQNEL